MSSRPRTDEPLKVLFREHTADLLELLGDAGARVRRTEVVELQTLTRRLDCLIEMERDGETYFRLVEFQARPRRFMLERFLLYVSQLLWRLRRPIAATVVFLFPPGPRERDLVLSLRVGGRELNRWQFDSLRLWEVDAGLAFERDAVGLLALVPLMKGGADLDTIGRACRRLAQLDPAEGLSESQVALLTLAGRTYTVDELSRIVGRDKMIQSSLWREARAEGRAEGRVEGRVEGRAEGGLITARALCLAMVREYHPTWLDAARPIIEACFDHDRLQRWILRGPTTPTEALGRLLGLDGTNGRT